MKHRSVLMAGALLLAASASAAPRLLWEFAAESNLYAPPLTADLHPAPGLETVVSDSEAKTLRCVGADGKELWAFAGGWKKRLASAAALGDAMEAGEVADAVIAQSQTQAKSLWKLREAPAELNTQMHPPVNFDVSLPQAEIGRFAAAIQAAFDARWPGHHTLFFGHVGDGNLHVSTDGATVGGACEAVEAELYRVVGAFHGSVSAEHGIGLHKKPFLALSRTPQELAAMRAIKAALDPLGLMNPGKVF